jgi:hypothetical protein
VIVIVVVALIVVVAAPVILAVHVHGNATVGVIQRGVSRKNAKIRKTGPDTFRGPDPGRTQVLRYRALAANSPCSITPPWA